MKNCSIYYVMSNESHIFTTTIVNKAEHFQQIQKTLSLCPDKAKIIKLSKS